MAEADDPRRPPRKRGRPPAEPGSKVSLWLPVSAHDRLIQVAKRQDQSVSGLLRQIVVLRLP